MRPLVPKMRPGRKKTLNWIFSEHVLEEMWNITICFSFFEAVTRVVSNWFLLNFGCEFWRLVGAVGKYWKQWLCNMFCVKSQISKVCGLSFSNSFAYVSLIPSWSMFLSFWVFFGVTIGSFLVPQVVLGVILEASKKCCKLGQFRQFGERGEATL